MDWFWYVLVGCVVLYALRLFFKRFGTENPKARGERLDALAKRVTEERQKRRAELKKEEEEKNTHKELLH